MILVTGDVVLDHNIYEGGRLTPDAVGDGSHYLAIPGGAMLTYGLLGELLPGKVRFGLAQTEADHLRSWPERFQTRALWRPVVGTDGKHWGLERHLGYGDPGLASQAYPATVAPDTKGLLPEVLVLDDGGLGFRESETSWPECLKTERPPEVQWVILKMSRPLACGKLWDRLMHQSWRERLIVIVSADQLRGEGSQVSGGLSWETTVTDILAALESSRMLRALKNARHLIVTMRGDAALWLEDWADGSVAQGQLIFDRNRCEGEWEEQNRSWKAYGFLSSVTASVACSLFVSLHKGFAWDRADLTMALAAGLSGTRRLRELGHGAASASPRYPFRDIAEHIASEHDRHDRTPPKVGEPSKKAPRLPYSSAQIGTQQGVGRWSILTDLSPWHTKYDKVPYNPARRIALEGPDRLPGVPCARFEKLQTLDRYEIDGLRTLRQLMLMYRDSGSRTQPLCLAVFGAPGSGKSFGLKQIAAGVFGEKNPILEFNLSQFADSKDLIGAYHQVRDKVLSGATPVVFWDEFDTRTLAWLQYFLAPMQDGAFQEGQLTHFVGKCVFVFAGGTSETFEEFRKPKNEEEFKLRKGPDFVSRIAGHLDVAGPNPRKVLSGPRDREFPVRRAILMRGILGLGSQPLKVEPGLLTALLAVSKYCNGARSLEKLVCYIRDRGGFPLRGTYLPPDDVLALYVEDVAEFHRLTRKYATYYAEADQLARAIHQDWFSKIPPEQMNKPAAKPWDELTPDLKDSNFAAALRTPEILELAGLTLEEGTGDSPEADAIIASQLEQMAEAEHGGWEEHKRIDGWTHSKVRNDAALRHDALVPYTELPEDVKDWDRNAIRKYKVNAQLVGFRIVPLPQSK